MLAAKDRDDIFKNFDTKNEGVGTPAGKSSHDALLLGGAGGTLPPPSAV